MNSLIQDTEDVREHFAARGVARAERSPDTAKAECYLAVTSHRYRRWLWLRRFVAALFRLYPRD